MQVDPQGEAPIAALNVTPLVDVALVLVIIFMITMPQLVERAMRVSASQQQIIPVGAVQEPILVEVSSVGLMVDGAPVPGKRLGPVLRKMLERRSRAGAPASVAVQAGKDVSHGTVVEVLDVALAAGAKGLDLLEPSRGGR